MPRKCKVFDCRTGYRDEQERWPQFRFPKDMEERERWLKSLPNKNLKLEQITDNMTICAKHWKGWREGRVQLVKRSGSMVPKFPPDNFTSENIPPSTIPTQQPLPRTTVKTSAELRNTQPDELEQFLQQDALFISTFHQELEEKIERNSNIGYLSWGHDNQTFSVFSKVRKGPIHSFSIYFTLGDIKNGKISSLYYESYVNLKRVKHPQFDKIKGWEMFDTLMFFICQYDHESPTDSNQFGFILDQVNLMNKPKNQKLYDIDDLLQAFQWYTISRPLYSQLRSFIKLPSISTLQNITRIAKNMDDAVLFTRFFMNQELRSRFCILIADEVYVKATLSYSGGEVFGYALNDPDSDKCASTSSTQDSNKKVATTLLCLMIKCFFTGEKFLVSLIPVNSLDSKFLTKCLTDTIQFIHKCKGHVMCVILDNNRTNQKSYCSFTPLSIDRPWIVKSPADENQPLYIMYDPVHLIKNLRNNWESEPTRTLQVPSLSSNAPFFACWNDLVSLHKDEKATMMQASKLTDSALNPSNLQKQKVSLALQVFCEETSAALKTSTRSTESYKNTAKWIDLVVQLWKVLNCKSKFHAKRHRDPDRAVIDSLNDHPKAVLNKFIEIARAMTPAKRSTKRFKSLTWDTGDAVQWTLSCLLDLSHFLLTTESPVRHDYVPLGFFQQDDIEQHFGYFRMSAGCN